MKAPMHLNAEAAECWAEITAGMSDAELEFVGSVVTGSYAVAVARQRDAQARIDREGIIVANQKGEPSPHPALAIEKSSSGEVRAFSSQFRELRNSYSLAKSYAR